MTTPSNTIQLLNVNLKTDRKDTYSFASESAQATFFGTKVVQTAGQVSYVRKDGVIRFDGNVESLFNVNYLRFKNSQFGVKWFYAFIVNVKYINPTMAHIEFEIDEMQTWYFQLTYKDCYIERKHVEDDTIGLHRVEENLATGDFVIDEGDITDLNDLWFVIGSTYDPFEVDDVKGDVYGRLYSGLRLFAYDNATDVNAFIDLLATDNKLPALITMFTASKYMSPVVLPDGTVSPSPVVSKIFDVGKVTTIGTHTVKNNKLLTYPYNFFTISNNQGSEAIYKYEDFQTFTSPTKCSFEMRANFAPNPTIYLTPFAHKETTANKNEAISLSDFPLLNWSYDNFDNWLGQNFIGANLSLLASSTAVAGGLITANPLAVGGGIYGIAQTLGGFAQEAIRPNPSKGSFSGSGNIGAQRQTYTIQKKTVRDEYAKIIDSYFDRFGYKVMLLETPQLVTRVNWNYIKLAESNIFGNIPQKDLEAINRMFLNGVTFWHNDELGNYNRTNVTL